ncbi:transketolase [Hahella sp. CCB-MM4]|uniref:transketolase n=1 Tax=Hahella sp. (strain CCB-MM4) TaxID=1926491 RepID=UPI000B9A9C0E|nr:transketolase [Hahella sp. CCB-MM4]OZG73555.1 transketolase [Hahella sp. CCB-MM4]
MNSLSETRVSRKELADAVRMLSIDAVEAAGSGHPGAPMGMADIAEVLWRGHLKHNPKNPHWPDRDRFVLSNGHASMLLYSLLHLSGYDLPIDELKRFRQLDSKTPGHPEYRHTPGVETTTGPLGQGFANAVGFALAEKILAAQFNRGDHSIVDHRTYVFLGDGCMMEGISHEAASLAGTHQLGKLIAFYDDNQISIDGDVSGWFSDDTPARFRAYGWHVIESVDGHDSGEIHRAILEAKNDTSKPSLICCKTRIGFGSPNKAGSHQCHGAPLGVEETAEVRRELNWPHPAFAIPDEIYQEWDATDRGELAESEWSSHFHKYEKEFPELAAEFIRRTRGELPIGWEDAKKRYLATFAETDKAIATRKCSQNVLDMMADGLPELLGGSADLTPSNLTDWKTSQSIELVSPGGNYMHYGVREFGMAAVMNGIALHSGFIPFGGTFLMFMEYSRNAVRMAALMGIRTLFVYTHDSIGLGEDGPTHQPIEQTASLRLIPNFETWRPCDQVETAQAWFCALERKDGPSALVLSRQGLDQQPRTASQIDNISRGGYVLRELGENPELILIATGSEVSLAGQVAEHIHREGRSVRLVSMPCLERFLSQDAEYQEAVLPAAVSRRVAIECGEPTSWYRIVGSQGKVIGMNQFAKSAPANELFKAYGFTTENILEEVRDLF